MACEDSPQRVLFHFLLFSFCPLSFYCTLTLLLSLSQCHQPLAAFSTRLCKMHTLWRTSRVAYQELMSGEAVMSSETTSPLISSWSYPSSIVKKHLSSLSRLGIQYSPVSVHVTCEFLCVHVSANWHSWVWQTRTYVHCKNRSLIQSLGLMCLAA